MLLILCLLLTTSMVEGGEFECTSTYTTMKGYIGWPAELGCLELIEATLLSTYEYDEEGKFTIECTITDRLEGKILMNKTVELDVNDYDLDMFEMTHRLSDRTSETSTIFDIQVKIFEKSVCAIEVVSLSLEDFPQDSCEENLEMSISILLEGTVMSTKTPRCVVPRDSKGPRELVDLKDTDVDYYWVYNCGELPKNARNIDGDDTLILDGLTFEDNPGAYTCVVEYKGMKRYRVHYKMCVKPITSTAISVSCPNYKAEIGADVQVECTVDAGIGSENRLVFMSRFNKLDGDRKVDKSQENISCVVGAGKGVTSSPNDRFSCILEQNNVDEMCFDTPPSKEDIKSQQNLLKMTYRITNLQESDFGEYMATINRLDIKNETRFELTLDRQPGLERSTVIIIVCLSALVGVGLFTLMVCLLCGLEIRWMWKRNFDSGETERKSFSAYLAYYYNKDMRETSPVQLEAFVMNLNTRIQRIGGTVYDKCRDPLTKQYVAENITVQLKECHRVIIILTPEYIRDQWSVFEAYEAWKNVIEFGIPIIFITFPTTTVAIQGLNVESRTALNNALKRHKVINWKGELPFSRHFRMKLEIYMPKLPRPGAREQICITEITKENGTTIALENDDTGNGDLDNNQNVFENAV